MKDDDDNLMITMGGCHGECGADDYECYGDCDDDYDDKDNDNCLIIAMTMTIVEMLIKVCVIKQ